ncbi:hypothetical protein M7I_3182 [Glarea lozoyensis 74030]|uniref:Uncharacterized protein n=1 Tax=Glarea lozoyensis (strain ATCC 74030 / MF5533) TaxID=1104152 RepID=H0EKU9_GLAL7|nr:hypothetical protein M7I_3182 [Glarea lozoyensis 74030]
MALQIASYRSTSHSSEGSNRQIIEIRISSFTISQFSAKDIHRKLCHGRTVELGSGQFAGDFLRITQIIRDTSTTEIFLRGLRFRRTRCLEHMLIKRLNEVCLQVEIDADDHRPVEEQSAIQVPLSEKVYQPRNDNRRLKRLER